MFVYTEHPFLDNDAENPHGCHIDLSNFYFPFLDKTLFGNVFTIIYEEKYRCFDISNYHTEPLVPVGLKLVQILVGGKNVERT